MTSSQARFLFVKRLRYVITTGLHIDINIKEKKEKEKKKKRYSYQQPSAKCKIVAFLLQKHIKQQTYLTYLGLVAASGKILAYVIPVCKIVR